MCLMLQKQFLNIAMLVLLSFRFITGILILYFLISRNKVQEYLSLKLLIVSISFEFNSVVGVFTFGQNWVNNWSADMQLITL